MSAHLLFKISVNFTKTLVKPVSMVKQGTILVVLCKLLEHLSRFKLRFDALTIFESWVHFHFVVLRYLDDCR